MPATAQARRAARRARLEGLNARASTQTAPATRRQASVLEGGKWGGGSGGSRAHLHLLELAVQALGTPAHDLPRRAPAIRCHACRHPGHPRGASAPWPMPLAPAPECWPCASGSSLDSTTPPTLHSLDSCHFVALIEHGHLTRDKCTNSLPFSTNLPFGLLCGRAAGQVRRERAAACPAPRCPCRVS